MSIGFRKEDDGKMICGHYSDGTPGCRHCEADRFVPIEGDPPPRSAGYREPKIIPLGHDGSDLHNGQPYFSQELYEKEIKQ